MSNIIKIILISFVVLSCQTTEKWLEIPSNIEIKVFSERGLNLTNDYLFKWTPPLKYSDRTSSFEINPDYKIDGKNLYFTPKVSENYLISLEVKKMVKRIEWLITQLVQCNMGKKFIKNQ